jgi:diguanylate cyclase (GGDEF)-like protein
MSSPSLPPISPLRGLLEVTRLLRAEEELPELLAAIARTIAESLGYSTVAVNLYRPAWDDFCVTTVHGSREAQNALLGRVRDLADWERLLDERFLRRGAYVIPYGEVDWDAIGVTYVPDLEPPPDPDGWHPEDALFVPMRHSDGHLLGILSVDELKSGLRAGDEELDVLSALTAHAAVAVQAAQESGDAARHRLALEELLAVSSRLTAEPAVDEILRAVCSGIRDALGFLNVYAQLVDPVTARLEPRAAVGWAMDELRAGGGVRIADVEPLLEPEFEIEGCYLLPDVEARRRVKADVGRYVTHLNGSGRWAWNQHWLFVPLRDVEGELIGMIWVDEPSDRLLPSADRLQALRIFANQAAAAVVSAAHQQELRFLADHDPLTRLLNRRAFVDRLDAEVARAARYGRSFALVLCDLDGFKELNDRYGHSAGDEALQTFASILDGSLRRPDQAFRIGGDEFALLLAEATDDDARAVVGRATSQLEASADPRHDGVRASYGVASCPEDAPDAQTLFRLADEALYLAKRNGSGLQFVA